jgi:hypothetical protein
MDSHRVFTSPDIEEGVSAFFAKRAPVFTAGRKGSRQGKGKKTDLAAASRRRHKRW